MKELLTEFNDYLRLNNRSNSYGYQIKPFVKFVEENKIDIYNITVQDLTKYILIYRDSDYSVGYINNLIKSMRFFYRFLVDREYVDKEILNIVLKIKLSEVKPRIKDSVNRKELDEIIRLGVTYCNTMPPVKLRAIFYFLFYTGIRKESLLHLKREDIDLKDNRVIVNVSKNDKRYTTFFNDEVNDLLKKYFKYEKEKINAFNITADQLLYVFRILKNFAPKGKYFSPHGIRHSYAMNLANNDVDMGIAQILLGHDSLKSTQIYYKPNLKTAENIYKKKMNKRIKK